MKGFIFLAIIATMTVNTAIGQCTVVAGNNSYQVNMTVYPVSLSNVVTTGGDCTFRTRMYYSIEIVGTNPPANMYTLQGRVHCAGQNRTFDLPNQGGTGFVVSANGQAPYINGNCAAYDETYCDETVIIIQGPNIPYQEIICGNGTPLPIELLEFEGVQQNNAVLLSFATASEKNNDFFTVEQSIDGTDWTLVNTVNGNGTTEELSTYSVLDESPENGMNYYRLSQTDRDGNTTLYKTIGVQYNAISSVNFSMYPNPTINAELNIAYESDSDAPVRCTVYDMMGKQVASYDFFSSNKLEKIVLPENQATFIVELEQANSIIARQRIFAN